MKICEEVEEKEEENVHKTKPGQIWRKIQGVRKGRLFLITEDIGDQRKAIDIQNGKVWVSPDAQGMSNSNGVWFEEVTDQYCLKKVKS